MTQVCLANARRAIDKARVEGALSRLLSNRACDGAGGSIGLPLIVGVKAQLRLELRVKVW